MVTQVIVLTLMIAWVPEADVSDKFGMLLSTCCSMSLLMPGQYMHCLTLY